MQSAVFLRFALCRFSHTQRAVRLKTNLMERIYKYFRDHRVPLWMLLGVTFCLFIALSIGCHFEENILKLLPSMEGDSTLDLAFADLKVKDKVFVQVLNTSEGEYDENGLAEIMDAFMQEAMVRDSATHYISNTLYDIDPELILNTGMYLMDHAPAYLDFTDQEMDSLTSEEHILQTVKLYLDIMESDMGSQFYDILAYDPCGIVIAKTPLQGMLESGISNLKEDTHKVMPFYSNHLFTGDTLPICIGFISPTLTINDSREANYWLHQLEDAKQKVEKDYPGSEVLFHGTILQSAGNSRRIKRDLPLTIGISLLIIVILLAICFKRPKYILIMMLPIAYGAFFALAFLYCYKGGMSLMALGLGAVVLGVALSYCMHVLIHYIYTGNGSRTVKDQTKPVLMGSLTTIGAFAGLLFTQSALLSDFGFFASLAIIGTTVASLIFMPQFFPRKYEPNKKAFALMERMNAYDISKNKPICAIVLIFVAVCICFSGKYTFDSDLHNINYFSSMYRRSMTIWNENSNHGLSQQYYAATAPTLDEALEKLGKIESTADSLVAIDKIEQYTRTSVLMPSLSVQEERINHWHSYYTPERQKTVWHNVCMACKQVEIEPDIFEPFRMTMAETAEPEIIYEALNIYDEPLIPLEISCNFVEYATSKQDSTKGNWMVFFPVKTTAENFKPVMSDMSKADGCIVLDPFFYTNSLVELVHQDFNKIMLISSIFVFLLLLVSYRNLWVALIAFIPMMLSWYTVLGAMALFHQSFNLINIVISSFIFGIGVDYSIFIMDGLLKQTAGTEDKTLTYHKTAITISGTVLCICMFSLCFAQHPALNSIAFASLVGMITTMMLSYTLQPNLYKLYIKIKSKKQQPKV